jgi:hypothetical protein
MNRFTRMALAAGALALSTTGAWADETIKWLHVEVSPVQVGAWTEVARAF